MARDSKNLIPLNKRSPEEKRKIQSAGGKAAAAKKQELTKQKYLLGKLAGVKIVNKNTIAKYKKMGFDDDEMTQAAEIALAIMEGAKKGDVKLIELYMRVMGEDKPQQIEKENNLLDALINGTKEDVNTDDIPELQQTAESGDDMVEQTEV